MTHASLFSGIGGPEVAAQMLGWDNLFHCEINPFGRRVLEYHFPNSVSYEDIKKTDFSQWRGRVDVLTGGFPCQPFSYAGKRAGAEDDRYLWPEMLRAISECQPTWVVGENVSGITTMVEQESVVEVGAEATLFEDMEALQGRTYEERGRYTIDRVCADLEAIGYAVQPVLIPACAVGAPHRRDRVFIIAQNTMYGGQLHGQHAVERDQRDERHVSAGDSERLCDGASGTTIADTDGSGQSASERTDRRDGQTMDGRSESVSFYGIGRFGASGIATNTDNLGLDGRNSRDTEGHRKTEGRQFETFSGDMGGTGGRWEGFPSVSPVHRGNDGLPFDVHDLTIPFTQWRTESLKAYGNAIVPQVMYEIFRAIEIITKQE